MTTTEPPAPDDASGEAAGASERRLSDASTAAKASWFAGLDGLRAIAAFAVLVTHVGIMSGFVPRGSPGADYAARGEVGVALFFVLSGFLLYRPFVAARLDNRPALATRRYLRRRFLRIFPAYWLALTVLGVLLDTRDRNDFDSVGDIFLYYTLLQSWSESTALGGLQQAWTLHNELIFYLLLPLWAAGAVWVYGRLPSRRAVQVEVAVLVTLAVLALGWRLWLHSFRVDYSAEAFDPRFHWLLGQMHMFVPGMGLALALEWSRRHGALAPLEWARRHPLACWALAAAAFWAVSTRVGLGSQIGAESMGQDLGKELLYAAVGFFLVLPVAVAGSELPRTLRWLSSRVMVTLGVLSYGIYLWHVGAIDIYMDLAGIEETVFGTADTSLLPMLAATAALSVGVAAVSYVLVEKTALRHKDPRGKRARPPRDPAAVPTSGEVGATAITAEVDPKVDPAVAQANGEHSDDNSDEAQRRGAQ